MGRDAVAEDLNPPRSVGIWHALGPRLAQTPTSPYLVRMPFIFFASKGGGKNGILCPPALWMSLTAAEEFLPCPYTKQLPLHCARGSGLHTLDRPEASGFVNHGHSPNASRAAIPARPHQRHSGPSIARLEHSMPLSCIYSSWSALPLQAYKPDQISMGRLVHCLRAGTSLLSTSCHCRG